MQTAPPPSVLDAALAMARAAVAEDAPETARLFAKTWTAARDHDRKRTVDGDAVEVGQ